MSQSIDGQLSPSNNLKEQVADYISDIGANEHSEVMAQTILNLTIDTILTKPEMQDEPDESTAQIKISPYYRNKLRADLRAMLEGMKS